MIRRKNEVDGWYGPVTEKAVKELQKPIKSMDLAKYFKLELNRLDIKLNKHHHNFINNNK